MRPTHPIALRVVLACALGVVAHRVAVPRSLASLAASPIASTPAHTPARPVESTAPLSPPDKAADRGLLLARRCLALAECDPLAAMEMALANHLQDVDSGLLTSLIRPARDEAMISVLHQWALRDPETVRDWADSFRDDRLKTRALAEIQGIQDRHL